MFAVCVCVRVRVCVCVCIGGQTGVLSEIEEIATRIVHNASYRGSFFFFSIFM